MEVRKKKGAGTCTIRVFNACCMNQERLNCQLVRRFRVLILSFLFFFLSFSSGTEAGIRLYLDEIVSITCPALTSQSWATRAQAAVTISAVAQKLGKDLACYEF